MKKRICTLWAALAALSLAACSTLGGAATPSAPPPGSQADTGATSAAPPSPAPGAPQPAGTGRPAQKEEENVDNTVPKVYMTTDISPAGMMAAYRALGRTLPGKVAVKLSTGEAGNTHYLDPSLIEGVVKEAGGTIVECNTAYGGSRASTEMHRQVAADHGFTAISEVDIMDAEGSMELPVAGGTHLTTNLVGASFANYDAFLILSHFKGHAMGGFGGAIKNISIGIASSQGKNRIHSAGASDTTFMSGDQDSFLESMAEAAKSVSDALGHGENMMYISVMNHLSVDCDCDGNPAAPDMHDIGILASLDAVALDQACVDLVYAAPDGASLIRRIESRNGLLTLKHAEDIGLGSREYTLVSLDG